MSDKPRPAAWLHSERPDAYVITDKVKCVLCRAHGEAPPHTAKYTIPLYTEARIAELEAWMRKSIDDSYCGVIPSNHIERGKALLGGGE